MLRIASLLCCRGSGILPRGLKRLISVEKRFVLMAAENFPVAYLQH